MAMHPKQLQLLGCAAITFILFLLMGLLTLLAAILGRELSFPLVVLMALASISGLVAMTALSFFVQNEIGFEEAIRMRDHANRAVKPPPRYPTGMNEAG